MATQSNKKSFNSDVFSRFMQWNMYILGTQLCGGILRVGAATKEKPLTSRVVGVLICRRRN